MVDHGLELLNEAKEILQRNTIMVTIDGKPYERTIPSRDYYVHQWLWDSAGIAMGLVHLNEEDAFNELLSLIAGQWNNGLIPHIIYNPGESRYYPPADQWQTSSFTRNGIKTSGITDPPLLAIAAAYICDNASDEQKKRDFINKMLPSVMAYHDYLKRYRDPEDCGLLTIVHPWESGTDDSPRWDSLLKGRHQAIAVPTNASCMPLYAEAVTDDQLDILLQRLANTDEFCTEYPVPSTAINSQYFDKERYWRGPTWPITNFFILEGLKRCKARHKNVDQLANFLMQKTIQMIKDNGFWEYFDPTPPETESHAIGMGFSSFSWTAAILIQLINTTK